YTTLCRSQVHQPLRTMGYQAEVPGPGELRLDPEQAAHRLQEEAIDLADGFEGAAFVEVREQSFIGTKPGRARVVVTDRLPVPARPARVADPGLADALVVAPFHHDRHRQPLDSLPSFDAVPVAPIAPRVLDLV